MTSCTGSVRGGFWGFWKMSVELGSWLGRRSLTFACSPKPGQWPCGRCRTCFGADGKASIERLCLSPYVEKPFNSRVIKKSFVPELRSRYVFFVFRHSYVIYVRYGHYECFAYRYEYVYFTYSYLATVHWYVNGL